MTGGDRRRRLYTALCALPALVLLLSAFVPLVRDFEANDFDWPLLLNELHGSDLAFGKDIVFSYGPWGFVWGGHHPRTFLKTCLIWSFLACVVWWIMFRLVQSRIESPWRMGIVLVVLVLPLGGNYTSAPDVRLLLLPILLLLYHFLIEPRPLDAAKLVLVAALAFAGLIKFTVLVAGVVAIGAITVDQLARREVRLMPLTTFLISLATGWMLADQRLADFGPYLSYSLSYTGAYAQAMSLWSKDETRQVLSYLGAGILLLILLSHVAIQTLHRRAVFFITAMEFLLWLIFRCGYVRHDSHELTSTILLLELASLACVAASPIAGGAWRRLAWVGCVVTAAGVAWLSLRDWNSVSLPTEIGRAIASVVEESRELGRLVSGSQATQTLRWQTWMDEFKKTEPLPQIQDSTDLLPRFARSIIAHDLDYRPRPTLDSYFAITPKLAALNASFFAGPLAPESLFYSPEPTIDHFPMQDDSLAWLEIIRGYRLKQTGDKYLHLSKRDKPRTAKMTLLSDSAVPMNTRVEVLPGTTSAPPWPLWAKIEVRQTAMGWLANHAYKPPLVYINIWTWSGETRLARMLPAIAANGFLIAPIPLDNKMMSLLLADELDTASMAYMMPRSIVIGASNPPYGDWCYEKDVRISIYRMTIEP